MIKSKVERAAHLLDDGMRVHFSQLRVSIHVRSADARALDAAASLAGEDAVPCYPGVKAQWRCGKEGSILKLLQQCVPHMSRQQDLAKAVIEFLEADTAEGMFNALIKVWKFRERRYAPPTW